MRLAVQAENGTMYGPGMHAVPPRRVRPRVLVADDDADVRLLVAMLLDYEGYDVLQARDGRQAVGTARRERPDVVIIDLDMPDVDGYQAIAAMRTDPMLAAMPIVVHSGERGSGVEQRVRALGADVFVPKTGHADVLLAHLHGMMRLR